MLCIAIIETEILQAASLGYSQNLRSIVRQMYMSFA